MHILNCFFFALHTSPLICHLSIMVSVKPSYLAYAIVSSIFTALSTVCVTLRFFQRQRVGGLQWDDWTILLALIISVACLVVILLPTSINPRILQDVPNGILTETELNSWAKVGLIAKRHVSAIFILNHGLLRFFLLHKCFMQGALHSPDPQS